MPQLMLFRLIYNRKSFKLRNAKKYWVASRERSSLKDCFTLYLDGGRRKTMSQLFFCLLSKTKPQPVFPGCRARFRSLHYNAPKPHLSWHRLQNSPRSAPESLSWAHRLHGQDVRRDNMLHIPPQDQPPGCAQQQEWIARTSQVNSWSAFRDAEFYGPRGSSRKEQGEVEGSRRSKSPWLRSVCVNSLCPHKLTQGVPVLHPLCWTCWWALRGCGSVPKARGAVPAAQGLLQVGLCS